MKNFDLLFLNNGGVLLMCNNNYATSYRPGDEVERLLIPDVIKLLTESCNPLEEWEGHEPDILTEMQVWSSASALELGESRHKNQDEIKEIILTNSLPKSTGGCTEKLFYELLLKEFNGKIKESQSKPCITGVDEPERRARDERVKILHSILMSR